MLADALLDPTAHQDIIAPDSLLDLEPALLSAGQASFAGLPTALARPALAKVELGLPEPHPDRMTRLPAA